MLKKTLTYTDYNGTERTEDFYFNISKSELIDMEMSEEGGLRERLDRIIKEKDAKKLYQYFKELVSFAYGIKSDDGKRFIKSPELTAAFVQTEAYSDFFTDLATNDAHAAEFVNGIMPKLPATEPSVSSNAVKFPSAN